ncbi:MAG TPA: GntR family transcriptional regulator [Amycolatopsis sp.]|nr:GntR family transcriptional regulator [Amycolatopsis sp.]
MSAEAGQNKLPVGLLGRPQTRLADEVAHVLRDLILRGELEPGSQLLQIQLSERLGVSRTPLREAFRILEPDGLLRSSNGNKTVEVVELGHEPLIETYQVREVIDGLAARLAARPVRPRHHAHRRRDQADGGGGQVDAGHQHLRRGARGVPLAILEASGNTRLTDFQQLVRISTQLQLTRHPQRSDSGASGSAAHDAIQVGNE